VDDWLLVEFEFLEGFSKVMVVIEKAKTKKGISEPCCMRIDLKKMQNIYDSY
jgi:hypothetical protein